MPDHRIRSLRARLSSVFAVIVLTFVVVSEYLGQPIETLLTTVYTFRPGAGDTVKVTIGADGVPKTDYGSRGGIVIGTKRNAVTISQHALEYRQRAAAGDPEARRQFLACAKWLSDNVVREGDVAYFVYDFPWNAYGLPAGWRSALAQGQALAVFGFAFQMTNDPSFLTVGSAVLESFYREVRDGGVARKTKDGWWYEEYAGIQTESRVLNGMMFATLGLWDYWQTTGDTRAKVAYERGLAAIAHDLPLYDWNGFTRYDALGRPARKYHVVHIELAARFYQISGMPVFLAYHERWLHFLARPFLVRLVLAPTDMMLTIAAISLFAGIAAGATFHIAVLRPAGRN